MLRRMKDLKGFAIAAKDGDIGQARDFIFDDSNWTVRYVLVDTQPWVPGGKVLISPIVTGQADWEGKKLPVLLNREQVKNSPDIRAHEELSAREEVKYGSGHGWASYWMGSGLWGRVPAAQQVPVETGEKPSRAQEASESHLHSMNEVVGYAIQATDGAFGQVGDFIIDDEPWVIRYMVVDTGNWLPGKKVIVSPAWIAQVDWKNSNVYANLSREAIKSAPEFEAGKLDRAYEEELYKHYGRDNYWWC